MTHFAVLVNTGTPRHPDYEDVNGRLVQLMAPYNEEIQVTPYRDYDIWIPDEMKSLPASEVPAAMKAKFGDDESRYHDPDRDECYSMSTYNPDSKWDYWRIAGQYPGLLIVRPGSTNVERGELGWEWTNKDIGIKDTQPYNSDLEVDVCQWGDIDWDAMGARTLVEMSELYGRIESSGKSFMKPSYYEEEYGYVAGEGAESFAKRNLVDRPMLNHLVTPNGEWHEAHKTGWFGMHSETDKNWADEWSKLTREFAPTDIVAVLDCHI